MFKLSSGIFRRDSKIFFSDALEKVNSANKKIIYIETLTFNEFENTHENPKGNIHILTFSRNISHNHKKTTVQVNEIKLLYRRRN